MRVRPPILLSLLARLLVWGRDREFVLEDLDELYAHRLASGGRLRAIATYLQDVFVSMWRAPGATPGDPGGRPSRPRSARAAGTLLTEARHVIRSIQRRPGFTILLVVTLALGMGPTVAILSMVEQLLMRPLAGAANSSSAAYLQLRDPESNIADFNPEGLSLHHFDELRAGASLVAGMASYGNTGQEVSATGNRPIRILAHVIYGDFFEVLGVRAAEGRLIFADQTRLDADPLVVVISEDLRNRLFGPDGEVLGRVVQMNGHPVEVVGVAAGGFRGPVRAEPADAWLPHGALIPLVGFTRERLESPQSIMHSRLLVVPRPDVTFEAIEEQVSEILARLADSDPERAEELSRLRPTAVAGLHAPPAGRERTYRTLKMMTSATALLLLIACANVANLLLFENLARRGALATHRALGASTGRIARQHLMRSLAIAWLGAAGGAGLGWVIAALFRGRLLLGMPDFAGLEPDPRLVFWAVGALVATTLLFGVVPALLAGRFDLGRAIRTSHTRETGQFAFLRAALSAGQIALSLGLLIGGMLMVRTMMNLQAIDTGIDVQRVVGATFGLPRGMDLDERHALQRAVLEAVAAEPGVERAALDWYGPHGSQFRSQVGHPTDAERYRELPTTLVWQVSPGWFELFGLEAVSGRTFANADWQVPSSGAAVVTASVAQRLFGRSDVVGQVIWVRGATPPERRIVGVTRDYTSFLTITASPDEARKPSGPTDAVFIPHGDAPLFQVTVFAKASSSTASIPSGIQAAIESLLPDAPSPQPYLLEDRVDQIHREERLLGRLLLTLAGLGALMSGVGLFAAVYFMVTSRRRELGIRVALGADAARILNLVARSATGIVLCGLMGGFVVAYPLSRALQSRLYGIEHLDPVSYGTAAAALGVVALLACLAPAREALWADPVAVLREE